MGDRATENTNDTGDNEHDDSSDDLRLRLEILQRDYDQLQQLNQTLREEQITARQAFQAAPTPTIHTIEGFGTLRIESWPNGYRTIQIGNFLLGNAVEHAAAVTEGTQPQANCDDAVRHSDHIAASAPSSRVQGKVGTSANHATGAVHNQDVGEVHNQDVISSSRTNNGLAIATQHTTNEFSRDSAVELNRALVPDQVSPGTEAPPATSNPGVANPAAVKAQVPPVPTHKTNASDKTRENADHVFGLGSGVGALFIPRKKKPTASSFLSQANDNSSVIHNTEVQQWTPVNGLAATRAAQAEEVESTGLLTMASAALRQTDYEGVVASGHDDNEISVAPAGRRGKRPSTLKDVAAEKTGTAGTGNTSVSRQDRQTSITASSGRAGSIALRDRYELQEIREGEKSYVERLEEDAINQVEADVVAGVPTIRKTRAASVAATGNIPTRNVLPATPNPRPTAKGTKKAAPLKKHKPLAPHPSMPSGPPPDRRSSNPPRKKLRTQIEARPEKQQPAPHFPGLAGTKINPPATSPKPSSPIDENIIIPCSNIQSSHHPKLARKAGQSSRATTIRKNSNPDDYENAPDESPISGLSPVEEDESEVHEETRVPEKQMRVEGDPQSEPEVENREEETPKSRQPSKKRTHPSSRFDSEEVAPKAEVEDENQDYETLASRRRSNKRSSPSSSEPDEGVPAEGLEGPRIKKARSSV
ncbi:hypothetical protein LTR62_005152 [Meristemomyces frigidus]|uniref:Uncharacterized protein n=1 Tax=Meristemomyces frigidus TaxID=1508187 RepID=A0AAN7TPX9_9PEZI|nr:hypothetical protein LTR62_005152 [Meristemomyces frigidus]